MSFITLYLPRKFISRLTGFLVHLPLPLGLSTVVISVFSFFYNIKIHEAEKPISDYPSLGEFFIRKLKPGLRPVSSSALVVHPADSEVVQFGSIDDHRLIQAKGKHYRVDQLTNDQESLEKFDQGYFVTYYLCPTDYHRVHSPVDGHITQMLYTEGDLWPVNKWSLNNIPNLYPKNERVYVEIATEFGPVGVVFVGATNVGSIEVGFDPSLKTNRNLGPYRETYKPALDIEKGAELGLFRMGSTVVVLFSKEYRSKVPNEVFKNPFVKVGAAFIES